jgi:hypothetical protein
VWDTPDYDPFHCLNCAIFCITFGLNNWKIPSVDYLNVATFYPQLIFECRSDLLLKWPQYEEKSPAEHFTYDFHCRAVRQMNRVSATKSNLICGYSITATSV